MTLEEIKLRQLTNQYLVNKSDKTTVIRDLLGMQAQFMTNAVHSLRIRCSDFDEASVGEGLVKNWTTRGTVHVFAEDDLPLFMHCENGKKYRQGEWNGYKVWNARDTWALTPDRQKYLADVILSALSENSLTREELKRICREHGMTEIEESAMFDKWGGGIRGLCECGFINYVVQEKKAFCQSPEFTPIPENEAKLEIARRYFTNIAPATIHDAMYFFHATASQVKRWLELLPVTSAECGGKTYYYIENGKEYTDDIPGCVFLVGFDQLMLGYEKKESIYLAPEHMRGIFNLAGIVMPAILIDGRVVGKWQNKKGKLSITAFESMSERDKKLLTDTAGSLWSGIKSVDFK